MDRTRPTAPHGLIAVVRSGSAAVAETVARGLLNAGIRQLEITTTVPEWDALITALLGNAETTIGAGTVLSTTDAERALAVGAQFIVSPITVPKVVAAVREAGRPVIPGALTPTEVSAAWDLGASAVKVFPIDSVGGPAYVRALAGPLEHIPLVVSGGVSAKDMTAYLDAGCAAVCLGGALVDTGAARRGDHDGVAAYARAALAALSSRRDPSAAPQGLAASPAEPSADEQ